MQWIFLLTTLQFVDKGVAQKLPICICIWCRNCRWCRVLFPTSITSGVFSVSVASDDELTWLDSHQIVRCVEFFKTLNFPREECCGGGFVGWFGGCSYVTLYVGLVSTHDWISKYRLWNNKRETVSSSYTSKPFCISSFKQTPLVLWLRKWFPFSSPH